MAGAAGVEVHGPAQAAYGQILTPDALDFVAALQRELGPTRLELLERRRRRQEAFDAGELPGFLPSTEGVRSGDWRVAPLPPDLADRRVEITGPTDRKMLINALNSGAKVFMADFEDANAPTWENMFGCQANLIEAIERTITFESPEGRQYRLNDEVAVLLVRPRGWRLPEKHVLIDGQPAAGSLVDFGLYFFNNARRLLDHGTGPYFYLPKLESHLEARLWNSAFELGDHSAGLNAGRWDYMFSVIKKFRNRSEFTLPDRNKVTMTVPFMRAYTELLVKTCHRREVPAIGGMAAFIPSRRDPEVNEVALAKVRDDKQRESGDGFDGTWVAHPDLVPVAMECFDAVLGERPNQIGRKREEVRASAADLLNVAATGGDATEEIARSQVWQWVHNQVRLADGPAVTPELVRKVIEQELEKLRRAVGDEVYASSRAKEARELFERVALNDDFIEFLTLPAYDYLD